ncbi:MAG: nucleoside deaminase [Phycisphaeraceae bacterium]|nr:nucleoside deaminase [Phycisphaeraceae bacterium]
MRPRRPLMCWLALARAGRIRRRPAEASAAEPADLDVAMMRRAIELARRAALLGEVPVGAVVYGSPGTPEEGRVFGEAFNRRESDQDPSAHAEFAAIVAASRALQSWRLVRCSVAVTLEPCVMCAGLIVNARLGRVVYGADDAKAGAVRSLYSILGDRRLNHRPRVMPGVLKPECSEMLTTFFRSIRAGR